MAPRKRRPRKASTRQEAPTSIDPSHPGVLVLCAVAFCVFGYTFYTGYQQNKAEREGIAAGIQRAKEDAERKKIEDEKIEAERQEEARRREVISRMSVRQDLITSGNTRRGSLLISKVSDKRAVVVKLTSSSISLIPEDSLQSYDSVFGEARVQGSIETHTWDAVNTYYKRP